MPLVARLCVTYESYDMIGPVNIWRPSSETDILGITDVLILSSSRRKNTGERYRVFTEIWRRAFIFLESLDITSTDLATFIVTVRN